MRKLLTFLIILSLSFLLLNFLPTVQATTIFSDGFESGNFSQWTGTSGTPTIVEDPVHHGVKSAQFDASAEYLSKTISAQTTNYLRFYINIDTASTGVYQQYVSLYASGTEMYRFLKNSADDRIIIRYRSGSSLITYTFSATTISLDEWHCVEIKIVIHGSAGEYRLYLDSVEVADVTQTGLDTDNYGGITSFDLGVIYASSTTAYYDCVVVADAYIGPEVEGQQITIELSESVIVADSLVSQKNLYRFNSESTTVTSGTQTIKALYRTTGESTSVETIIETQKAITVSMIVEIASEIIISGILETTKHIGVTLIELLETVNVNLLLETVLPLVPLTMDDLAGLIILFFVVGLACSVGFVVAYNRRR